MRHLNVRCLRCRVPGSPHETRHTINLSRRGSRQIRSVIMINPEARAPHAVQRPFVTVVAILSLALGIGANAAIFSSSTRCCCGRCRCSEPERLVNLSAPGPKPGSQSCNQAGDCDAVFSYPMFRDLEKAQTVFTGIAAHSPLRRQPRVRRADASAATGMLVSGSYFPVLGLQPGARPAARAGRRPQRRRIRTSSCSATRYWRTGSARPATSSTSTMIVNGQTMTIVGVAPRGFEGTTLGARPRGLRADHAARADAAGFDGVRQPPQLLGLPVRAAEARRVDRAGARRAMQRAVPRDRQRRRSAAAEGHERADDGAVPGEAAASSSRAARPELGRDGERETPLTLLLGVTGARAAHRLREHRQPAARARRGARRRDGGAPVDRREPRAADRPAAHRVAAARGRSAALAGLLVARWTLRPDRLAAAGRGGRDAAGRSSTRRAALRRRADARHRACSSASSRRSTARGPIWCSTLKGQAGQPSGARGAARFRTSLATAQIALSMALLVAAGLFTKSLLNVSRVDLGLKTDNVVTFGVSPELNGYTPERSQAALRAARGASWRAAARRHRGHRRARAAARRQQLGQRRHRRGLQDGPGHRHQLALQRSRRRLLPDARHPAASPAASSRAATPLTAPKVAIVNEAFAKKFNLGRDAVGKRMSGRCGPIRSTPRSSASCKDAKYSEVKGDDPAALLPAVPAGRRASAR